MSGSPRLKVFNAQGEYIGCVKHYEDAACLIASYGTGAQVRYGHNKRNTLWHEGQEAFSAGESYDRAGSVMRAREEAMWTRAQANLCKNEQALVRTDGGCLACEADQGEACRRREGGAS